MANNSMISGGGPNTSLGLPMLDKVVEEVTEKLDYFNDKIETHSTALTQALGNLSNIKVEEIPPMEELKYPAPEPFLPAETITVPKLDVTFPEAPKLDIGTIEVPTPIPVQTMPKIDLDLPDAPILNNGVNSPIKLENVLPDVKLDYNLPTLPTFDKSVINVPNAPSMIDITQYIKDLDLSQLKMPDAPDAPILNLPTAPSLNIPTAPNKPTVDMTVNMPKVPNITLPDIGQMLGIKIPEFKSQPIEEFTGTPPNFTYTMPDNIDDMLANAKDVIGKDYYAMNADSLLKPMVTEIRKWMDGSHVGLGLPAIVEDALFNRGRQRITSEVEREVQTVIDQWAGRGYSLPQGALDKQIATIREEGAMRVADLNREVMVQRFEKQLEHIRFMTEQGMAIEKMRIDLWQTFVANVMEMAKFEVDSKIQLLNAQISIYNTKMEAFKAFIDVYKVKIEAAIARIQEFKAQVDAQLAIGQLNQQTVEIFKAKIEAVMANVDIYKALVQAETSRVDLIRTQFDVYKTEVQAFGEQIGAEKVKFDAFESQIKGETAKADVYDSLARMYASTVQGVSAKADVMVKSVNTGLEAARIRLTEYTANVDARKSDIASQVALAQNNTEAFVAQVNAFKVKSDVEISRVGASVGLADMTARTQISFAEAHARYADMNVRTNIANSEALSRFADMKSRTAIAVYEALTKQADLQLRTNIANSESYIKYVEARRQSAVSEAEMRTRYADMVARTNIATAETNARYADMITRTNIANAETKARYTEMNTRMNISYAEMKVKAYDTLQQGAMNKAQIALEAAKASGSFSAQLASGAMSAAHVSASMSASGSVSGSTSDSKSYSESHNYSY